MSRYIIRRLLALIPTLFFASVLVFSVVRLVPGDIIDLMLSENDFSATDQATRDQIEKALGLDKPIHVQYVTWISNIVLRGDFGTSLWSDRPVAEEIGERIMVTIELGVTGIIIALLIAIPIGIYSAVRQDTWGDHVGRSFSILALAIPSFWLATLVVILPAVWWGWSPPTRLVPFTTDPIRHISVFLIPGAILGAGLSAVTMRMTRTMMLEVLRQDYIRTAWAKGLSERTVVIRHAIRNAMIPVVTLIGLFIPVIIGGTVILERIFGIPGMGQLLLEAVVRRDYPIITGVFLLVGVVVIVVNLIVDLCYGLLDPKVRVMT